MSKRIAIIASHGGLETAFKVMNIALAGTATDTEVQVFFTFDGLDIIHVNASEKLTLPSEKQHYLKGFQEANVPQITDMIQMAQESGVKFIACQMTMDVLGLTKEDLIEGADVAGAMTFLDFAYDADVSLTF